MVAAISRASANVVAMPCLGAEPGVREHLREGLMVLRVVDGLGRGAEHGDAGVLEPLRQAQRGLPAEGCR